MLLGLTCYQAMAEDVNYSKAEEFAMALGVIDKANYEPNKMMSRAEFAEFIAKLLIWTESDPGAEEWDEYVFGEDNNNTLYDSPSQQIFQDVDVSLPQYKAIEYVYNRKYMNGMTATHFGPNYDITAGAAVKVFVTMLGHSYNADVKGGYPNGYMAIADDISLTRGMSLESGDFITYGDCTQLLFNALNIEVFKLKVTSASTVSYESTERTFMDLVLGLEKYTAYVEDNGITDYYGPSKVGRDEAIIGGVTVEIGKCEDVRDLIGREVDAYIRTNEYGQHILIHVAETEDDSVRFDADDFITFSNSGSTNSIKFYNEKDTAVSKMVNPKARVIYNNVAIKDYNKSIFDFDFGDITLISMDSDKAYDLIIVNDYFVGSVKKVDSAEQTIYVETLYKDMDAEKTFDLSGEKEEFITITDNFGIPMNFADIAAGDGLNILKSKDGKIIEVVVTKPTLEAQPVIKYENNQDGMEITLESGTYIFKNTAAMTSKPIIRLDKDYSFVLDKDGSIVWYEVASGDVGTNKKGVLLRAIQVEEDEIGYMIKFYTEDGKIENFFTEERIKLNNTSTKMTETVIGDIATYKDEVLLYKTNEQGKISSITLPIDHNAVDTDERGWYRVKPKVKLVQTTETDTEWKTYRSENTMLHHPSGPRFDMSLFYSTSGTTIFSVPSTQDQYSDVRAFSINKTTFGDSKAYLFNAYATDPQAILAETIVCVGGPAGGSGVSEQQAFLIEKISLGINEDGMPIQTVSGYLMTYASKKATPATYQFAEEVGFMKEEGTTIIDPNAEGYDIKVDGPAKVDDLEAGDIIRIATDAKGNISNVKMVYDYDLGKAYYHYNDGEEDLGLGVRGHVTAGYPLAVRGDYVRISYDLPHAMTSSTKIEAQRMYKGSTMVVEKSGKNVTMRSGSADDIISYEVSGKIDKYNKVVVIAYWAYTVGTVIYK